MHTHEERFWLVADALDGVIYDWDMITDTFFQSSGLFTLLGFQPNEIEADLKWWTAQIHPQDQQRLEQELEQTLTNQSPRQSAEYRVRHKDGHDIWVWDNQRIIYGTEGQPIRLIGCIININERKRLTDALAQSEDRFRLATEALRGLIYDWDAATDKTFRSVGMAEIVGYHPDEVPPRIGWWHEQIHPEDLPRLLDMFAKTVEARIPWQSFEYRVRHKDGRYIWVWDNCGYIYDEQGIIIRLVGCTVSIDDRKYLSAALSESEQRFRFAFESATDAMAISDENAMVVAANESYLQLYGFTREEVVGHGFEIIFPEEARPQAREQYLQVFEKKLDLPTYDAVVRRKDGTVRKVEARIGFVIQNGQRKYMLSVIRDLTERREAERALVTRYQLTADLTLANTVNDVAQIIVRHLMDYLGAKAGNIFVYSPADNMFEMLYTSSSLPPEYLAPWRRFPAKDGYPGTDVLKHGKSLWFFSAKECEEAYPSTQQFSQINPGASVMLPLIVASEVFGIIGLTFSESRVFPESERAFVTSLIFQSAQAIERARLAEQVRETAKMEERHRLARELHDSVSQALFSSSIMSGILPRYIKNQPDKAIKHAEDLHVMLQGAMAEMRTLLWEMRPENIVQSQLSNLLTQLSYATNARYDTQISFNVRAKNEYLLSPEAQVAFYRIAQESIHNTTKHGQATVISIYLRQNEQYTFVMVKDNGNGFDTHSNAAGLGLKNMVDRAAKVGARFDIKSRIGKGTRVRLLWMKPQTS